MLALIGARIPTFQAAELLVFLATNPHRGFTGEEVVASLRQAGVTVPAVREYCASFVEGGLLHESNGRFKYAPSSPELEATVSRLVVAYNERPVTLITVIYRIADSKLQSTFDSLRPRV